MEMGGKIFKNLQSGPLPTIKCQRLALETTRLEICKAIQNYTRLINLRAQINKRFLVVSVLHDRLRPKSNSILLYCAEKAL